MKYEEIIDISMPIHQDMVIYPGNPEFSRAEMKSKSGNTVSKLELGTHTGTHIDAPNHVKGGKEGIEAYDLKQFFGYCRVLDFTDAQEAITVDELEKSDIRAGERILFKTQNSIRGYDAHREDFIYLESEAAEYLAQQKVALVGTDYLSIKKSGLDDNTAHTALVLNNIPIIEGLDLVNAEAGTYTLIAMPLNMPGVDGSPIRAVLVR